MSHGRHSTSSEVSHLIAEARRMTSQELLDTYGIELLTDGRVIDTAFDQTYTNIGEWALACVEDDSSEYDDLADKYNKFDDEDY